VLRCVDRAGAVTTTTVAIDGLGGVLLAVQPGISSVRLSSPRLRFVDIVSGPDLRVLDLVDTAPGMHLTVNEAPRLAEIAVPSEGAGLTLHLCQLSGAPQVRVTGAVAQIDVAWWSPAPLGGPPSVDTKPQTALVAGGRHNTEPGHDAYIGPYPSVWPDVEWVMLLGGAYPVTLQVPDDVRCQTLSVQDGGPLTTLEVGLPLAALELRACPNLSALTMLRPTCKVRVADCRALAEVRGSGQVLTVGQNSGAAALTVSGSWHVLNLSASSVRELVAPAIVEVNLTLCSVLRKVVMLAGSRLQVAQVPYLQEISGPARVAVDPRSALGALREAVKCDHDLREALFADIRLVRGTNQLLRALLVLAELARAGVDAGRIWDARMDLLQRSRTDRWLWRLPDDLADDGWSADVRLWLYCRSQHPPARLWQMHFEREFQPEHLAAIARTLAAVPNDGSPPWTQARDVLCEILLSQLRRGAVSGRPIYIGRSQRLESDGLEIRVEARLQAVVRVLLGLRDQACAGELCDAMCGWLLRCLPCAEGLHLLAMMVGHGFEPAHRALTKVASDREIDPSLRRMAMALLLADPGSDEPVEA
jgi:hypothetical protein